jgi:hypothetical protein
MNPTTITPDMKKNKGSALAEIPIALACLGLLYLYFSPINKKIGEQAFEASKNKTVTEMEIAKNKFDQEASPDDKDGFNNGTEAERFDKLAPYLKTDNSSNYFAGSGISECRINAIGTDIEAK